MSDLLEVLKYVIPSLIVGATAVLTIKFFFDNEHKNRLSNLRDENRSTITPIRLQAYERIVLFLERISPSSLIIRLNPNEVDARTFHKALVHNIREEYEHNLSLQIYLSVKAWELVKNGKEELIMIVNKSASELPPEATGVDLAQKVFENYLKTEKPPLGAATEFLKREVTQFF